MDMIKKMVYNKQFLCLRLVDLDEHQRPDPMNYVTLFQPNVIVGIVLIALGEKGSGPVHGFYACTSASVKWISLDSTLAVTSTVCYGNLKDLKAKKNTK